MITASARSLDRLRQVVEQIEANPLSEVPGSPASPRIREPQVIRITSTTLTDGRYPGTVYVRDNTGFTLVGTAGDCWIDTPNGETLATSTYYYAVLLGRHTDGKEIYEVVATFGGVAFSGAHVHRNSHAGQVLTTGVMEALEWDAEIYDTDTYWSNDTALLSTRFGLVASGYYLVSASVVWTSNTTGSRFLRLQSAISFASVQVIATSVHPAAFITSIGGYQSVSGVAYIDAAGPRYVEAVVAQDSGGDITLSNTSDRSFNFSISRLGT